MLVDRLRAALAAQDENMQACLYALKTWGQTLALDVFGIGYSSLACLHPLPVDIVKIDRFFVCQANTSPPAASDGGCHAGSPPPGHGHCGRRHSNRAQADVVRALQCKKGQGYVFSRPLATDDLGRWIPPGD